MRGLAGFALGLTGALLIGAIGPSAHAAQFDPATGTVSLEGSAFSWGFDSFDQPPRGLTVEAKNAEGALLEPAAVAARISDPATPVIEGTAGLWMGAGQVERLNFYFQDGERLAHRRVEITFWQQPHGVAANALLAWFATGDKDFVVGMVRFLPTGRRTDDGWFELSSGPVDLALGSRLFPRLAIRTERGSYNAITTDPAATVLVDALAITDLGPQEVPDATCTLATEAQTCGSIGLCHFGRCVDSAALAGPVPAEALRGEYIDRRIFEVRHFNGNRVTDRTFEPFQKAMDEARRARSPKQFWNLVATAYERLGDGHGAPPFLTMTERPALGTCMHLGDADRLPLGPDGASRLLPMVFYANETLPASASLRAGDVLDTIDGMPVEQWKRLAASRLHHNGSPLAREVTIAPSIPALAMRTGGKLGMARCPAEIAATRRCSAEELERYEIDYAALVGEPMWSGDATGWHEEWLTCDNRFKRVGDEQPRGDYMYVATADDGDVRTLEINGVPHPSWAGSWVSTVQSALRPTSSKFLIDERTGYGGVFDTVDLIVNPFFDKTTYPLAEVFPVIGRELDEATRQRFLACNANYNPFGLQLCGEFFMFVTGSIFPSGAGTLADSKAALLISLDVSGNDYLTRFMQFRRPELTRVFGPCPTYGAFGSIYSLASYFGEMTGGSSQMGDSLVFEGENPSGFSFESGAGAMPDEVVFQTQSDLMVGRDTLVERAKAWLRE